MAVVLGLLVLTIVLFTWEILSVDVITLGMLLVLGATRVLTPVEAFAGFSEEIIVMLASVFVIGGALQETGVLDAIAGKLTRLAGESETCLVLLLLLVCSGLSAFYEQHHRNSHADRSGAHTGAPAAFNRDVLGFELSQRYGRQATTAGIAQVQSLADATPKQVDTIFPKWIVGNHRAKLERKRKLNQKD